MSSKWQAARRHVAGVHSDHKRIARGAAWVVIFALVAKLAGAAKEMAVAWRYGVSEMVDAYQIATTLVFWLPGTLVSVLTIVLVPMLVRLRQCDQHDRSRFLQELHGSVLVAGTVMAGLSLLLAPLVLPYLGNKLSVESRQITWSLTLGMAPLAMLSLMLGVCSARLMARERQVNTLLDGVPAAVILVLILLWRPGTAFAPLLWGTVLGFAVQALWSWQLAGRADGANAKPRFSRRSQHWPELYKAAGVMAVGQFVMSFITPLDQFTAVQLGTGAIAALGYANRVITLLIGIGAMAIARAILPVVSGLWAAGQSERARELSLKWAALMFVAGALVAMFAWALAPWGIEMLFERGAFTSQDTQVVADVFRWGLIQVPPYFAGLVLVQLMASQRRFRAITLAGFICLATKLPLNVFLSSLLGVAGISLATGLMYCSSFVYFAICSISVRRNQSE